MSHRWMWHVIGKPQMIGICVGVAIGAAIVFVVAARDEGGEQPALSGDQIVVSAGRERLVLEPCNSCSNERGQGCTLKRCLLPSALQVDLTRAKVSTAVRQPRLYVLYSGTRGTGSTYLERAGEAGWDLGGVLRKAGEIRMVRLIARTRAGDFRDYQLLIQDGGVSTPSYESAPTL